MLKLRKVAVTGGLSCGKSLVCRLLHECGAYVIDADQIVHQLLTPNTELGNKIVDLLGADIIIGGKIDRSRVAKKVFHQTKLLRELEALLHPQVYAEIQKKYEELQYSVNGPSLFVAEIPLLFETGGEANFDDTVAVIADPEICRARYLKAKNKGTEEFERRMANQLPPEEKAAKADYVITNNGSEQDLIDQVEKLCSKLTKNHSN